MESVQPGDILAKKYRVDRVLGEGGMGVVVAATHIELDQRVALKFLHAGALATPEALSRFQREARIAVKLQSEHVARVSDTGTLDNGAPYIVMEYLEGTDLSGQLEKYGPMPVGFAAECILQACDAIGEAHSHGVVHRDLKPANLFLTKRPDGSVLVKVLDFGISKAGTAVDGGMAMTKTGALMGSPLYMSPEQTRSLKTVDARTDVWALGVILYELLSGVTPFDADNFGDLLVQVMTATPTPLRQRRPDLPGEIATLVDGCLAKDPTQRVQSVAEIAQTLAPFCSAAGVVLAHRITALAVKSGITGDPRAASLLRGGPASAVTGAGWGTTHNGAGANASKSRRVWTAVGATVAVVIFAGVGTAVVRSRAQSVVAGATSAGAPSSSSVAPVVAPAVAGAAIPPAPSSVPSATPAPIASDVTATRSAPPNPEPPSAKSTTSAASPRPASHALAPRPVVAASEPPAPSNRASPPPSPPTPARSPSPGLLDTSN